MIQMGFVDHQSKTTGKEALIVERYYHITKGCMMEKADFMTV